MLNLSIIGNLHLEEQEKYLNQIYENYQNLLLENNLYLMIQISEIKNELINSLIKIGEFLFRNANIKEKIYFINLLNNGHCPKNINKFYEFFLKTLKIIEIKENNKYLIWECLNSFINLSLNNYFYLEEKFKKLLLNKIFELIKEFQILFNNKINPFIINIYQKIKSSKILIDPQIDSKKLSENNNINKLIVPISIEINIISYLFEIINKKNLSEDLKSRRESKEIINQLKSIFNDYFEKEKISFLLIEMTFCSYLKEKIIIKNKKGIYNFCLSSELCKNDKTFEFKLINELIEFMYISGFPKNEYHTIFKILLKIFEEIYMKVYESSNINEFYKNKLNQFEEIITQTLDNKFKFEEEEENEVIKRDKLENFLIDFNRINEFKGIGKLLYNKMEYSDYTFGNYLLKNEKEVFNKISFYYFYKLYFDENKIEVIKSYIKFIEICKYLFSHDNNLIALFSNKNQENKDFFIFFLKFI